MVWNGRKYPSGVYFLRLVSEGVSLSRKLVLIK